MKLLLDQNVPFRVKDLLEAQGWDVTNTQTLGMSRSTDQEIIAEALKQDRIVVSADRDFGNLLRTSEANKPSLVFLRLNKLVTAEQVSSVIAVSLGDIEAELNSGCIVVVTDTTKRIRRLPIQ